MTQANGAQLRQYIEQIEHLETEKAEIADLVKDIFQEANKWHLLFKDFRLSEDLGLHAWVTCPFIENKLAEEADKGQDRYVPWEDRRLVEFS